MLHFLKHLIYLIMLETPLKKKKKIMLGTFHLTMFVYVNLLV